MTRQPTYFIAHGSPFWLVQPNDPAPQFLKKWGKELLAGPNRPKTLLIISAHWETNATVKVTTAPTHKLFYDYYNFPKKFYDIKYPAKGDPEVANETIALLKAAGFHAVPETERGLDHGVFTPLIYLFPKQEIPVVQLSLPITNDPAEYYKMGQALQPLRDRGVMIAGAGFLLHNLRLMMTRMNDGTKPDAPREPWASEFVEATEKAALKFTGESRRQEVMKLYKLKSYLTAHPSPEHFAPFVVAAGAGGEDPGKLIHSRWEAGVVNEDTFQFGGVEVVDNGQEL
ncbi:catalytic LigB subunit of aromatic ring-opening dioxygenase [Chytriomyces sp. MP71]|nr:catalytic LigB subunit of aromatic ring-opening dioxygenase [Chytriomyces sp. MP71]